MDMTERKLLGLITTLCLAMLVWACGERGESSEADHADEGAAPTQAKKAEPPAPLQAAGKTLTYNFDSDATGKLPAHFHPALTGQGTEGTWIVKQDETAPSKPNVLAQTSTDDTDYRFPLAVLDEGSFKDLDLSVKFKAVSGKVDQAAGLVFRYQDQNNYYITRANALEDNYRLYQVVNGRRRQFAGANFRVTPNEWHTLRVECVGNQIKCYYDGEPKITATDETFKEAGKVGLWTKADSVTHFDDCTVTAK
jgi:hypothetical protein